LYKISKKSLHPQHPEIAITLKNIGLVYENNGEFQQTLSYIEKAARIFRHLLPPTDSHIIKTEQNIKHISSKLTCVCLIIKSLM